MRFRDLRALTALVFAFALGAAARAADDFPNRPIRIIVPVAVGGTVDLVARVLAERLQANLGQTVVVENKPGGSSLVGTQYVAKSKPDGYTLLATSTTFLSAPAIVPNPGYDPVTDFAHVSLTCRIPMVLVVPASNGAKSVGELIAQAKARPGEISFASSGNGSTGHIAAELFSRHAGIKLLNVQYKGNSQAIVDVIGGRIGVFFDQVSGSLSQIKAGTLRPLGVTTLKRSPVLPDVPTLDEAGLKGYEDVTINALFAPAGTPREIVQRLHQEVAKALAAPDLRQRFIAQGIELTPSASPEEFSAYVKTEAARYAKLAREANIKAD